jgi:ketosteroid isomerase-like protein
LCSSVFLACVDHTKFRFERRTRGEHEPVSWGLDTTDLRRALWVTAGILARCRRINEADRRDSPCHMNPIETVLQFLDRINQRDVDKLAELMAEDQVFTDSLGQSVHGRERVRAGWQAYFSFCPDYWVSHEEILQDGNLVAVFGSAGGTIAANGRLPPENKWWVSAAWRAVVESGLVKEWRVYADNKPVYDVMARRGSLFFVGRRNRPSTKW